MKFTIGEAAVDRAQRLSKWHPHFFILPRQVTETVWVWLEWGYRRANYHYGVDFHSWSYVAEQK